VVNEAFLPHDTDITLVGDWITAVRG